MTDSAWYHDAVAIAKENGLSSGFEDTPSGRTARSHGNNVYHLCYLTLVSPLCENISNNKNT
ncbi:hypothetical protein [Paenibacillus lautus]|uniref:hypothetical protein n=1 Tax=Paenibacillus lautus TaxID=1401 RepID=UPI0035313EA4